ncbi:MAG: hypothetical protein P4K93_01905 [Terracidiphilus sp.]|nr:hypothetical protein [Terracidiphilus sp.]MDR3796875.1 hypothetical protein [Terracidiphilus sp.]
MIAVYELEEGIDERLLLAVPVLLCRAFASFRNLISGRKFFVRGTGHATH